MGLGFRVQGLGFSVQGLGFVGFRVQGGYVLVNGYYKATKRLRD